MMIPHLEYMKRTAEIWSEAVRRAGCRAIFQLPWEDPSAFGTDERIFTLQRAPYKKVFPQCSLVVYHGAPGTTQCVLQAGCPSVVVAHIGDQFYWGSELRRIGVAGPM